jgi:hypothetical protein
MEQDNDTENEEPQPPIPHTHEAQEFVDLHPEAVNQVF